MDANLEHSEEENAKIFAKKEVIRESRVSGAS
jgi:hypothetical protein